MLLPEGLDDVSQDHCARAREFYLVVAYLQQVYSSRLEVAALTESRTRERSNTRSLLSPKLPPPRHSPACSAASSQCGRPHVATLGVEWSVYRRHRDC